MFFKKKPIYLDCYTTHNHVYDMFKIESAKKHVPDWFKNLPSTFEDTRSIVSPPTVKTCSGVAGYFKSGYIIPLWSDAQFGFAPLSNGFQKTIQLATQFADQVTKCQVHEQKQLGFDFMPDTDYTHFKIFSPWVFKCSEDIDWIWTQPTYNFKYPDELVLLPGIIEFKYNSNVFINFSMRKRDSKGDPKLMQMEAGQPLVQLIPITDREVIVRNHLVDNEQWRRIYETTNRAFFFNNHNKKRNFIKKKETESKCPFGFKK